MMRREHYEKVVVWDMLARYPELRHVTQVPKVKGLTLHWSLQSVGMNPESGLAAATALHRRTGHCPRMHYSGESLAGWKLREGDRVSCSVILSEKEAMDFLERWIVMILPQMRPFDGRSPSRVDRYGNVSFPRSQPMRFPALESRYERLNPRCSRSGLVMNLKRSGTSRGSKGDGLDRSQGHPERDYVRSMLTGRGIPFIKSLAS